MCTVRLIITVPKRDWAPSVVLTYRYTDDQHADGLGPATIRVQTISLQTISRQTFRTRQAPLGGEPPARAGCSAPLKLLGENPNSVTLRGCWVLF